MDTASRVYIEMSSRCYILPFSSQTITDVILWIKTTKKTRTILKKQKTGSKNGSELLFRQGMLISLKKSRKRTEDKKGLGIRD